MTTTGTDWLARSLQLTAPECYVLQNGSEADGRWVFKLTLLELFAHQVFRRDRADDRTTVLTAGEEFSRSLPPSMGVARELFLSLPAPVTVADLTRAASRKFFGLDGFVTEAVMPTLVGRGLFRPEDYKILFVISARRHVLTPAGEQLKHELEKSLMAGQRQFTEWANGDPVRALSFLAEVGSASLLLRPLYPEIQKLAAVPDEEFRRRGATDDRLFDVLDMLRDAVPFLVDVFADVDAGVDAGADGGDAGSDGGGDGGGGGE